MVADDDQAFRLATQTLLRRQGFACESVSDASGAVEVLGREEFDLLISDIHMPGNVGLELIEKLPHVADALPVILLTGQPSVQSAARSVRLRVVAYLVKPCDLDELLNIAEQAIANFRAFCAISSNRKRLEGWGRDLAQIEEVIRQTPPGQSLRPVENFLTLTLQNLLSVLLDLKQFTEALARLPGKEALIHRVSLHHALVETIQVLEKTKQSFKSKELGELRHRLEALLRAPPPGEITPERIRV